MFFLFRPAFAGLFLGISMNHLEKLEMSYKRLMQEFEAEKEKLLRQYALKISDLLDKTKGCEVVLADIADKQADLEAAIKSAQQQILLFDDKKATIADAKLGLKKEIEDLMAQSEKLENDPSLRAYQIRLTSITKTIEQLKELPD
jgi:chromosome segregation ATPase